MNAFISIVVVVLTVFSTLSAKVQPVHSSEKFNKTINAKQLCVAYFHHYVKLCKASKTAHKEQLEILKATSCVPRYKNADVEFLVINTEKPSLASIAHQYDVNSTPTFLLFKDGSPYDDEDGERARIKGCATKAQLIELLEDNVADDIDRIAKYKEEIRRKNMAESAWWYNYYGYPWYGYGRCGGPSWWGGSGYYGSGCYYPWYSNCRPRTCFNIGVGFCN